MRSSMLSTVTVTSGRIISTSEYKLTSLIGMTIFNNGLQFRIGEEDTFREIISAVITVSIGYKLPGGRRCEGRLLIIFFQNHIKNQHEKLLNGE